MKTLLPTLIFGLSSFFSNAQTWEFTLVGSTTTITNTVQSIGVHNTDITYFDFEFRNITTDTLDAIISRQIVQAPSDEWDEQLVWGNGTNGFGIDVDPSVPLWTYSESLPVPPNTAALFNIKLSSDPAQSPARYRYYVGVQGDIFQDSIDLLFYSTVSVDEVEKEIALSVSPNPASDNVSIKVSNFEKGNIKIVDVLGNEIKNDSFSGSTTINVSEFRNGVYFIIVTGEGMETINRKLVVRH